MSSKEDERVEEGLLRKKLITGAKWATALRIASQSLSWVVTLIMVRLLAPHDYGLNAMIEVPIELLMLFSTMGIDAAIIRYGQKNAEQLSAVFGFLLLINGIFFLALLFSAGQIAAYFNEPQLAGLLQATAVVFVLAPFRTIPNALLDMALDFKLKSQVELSATIVASLVSLVLAALGAGVWALVAAILLNAIVRAALLAYLRPWVLRPTLRLAPIRDLLKYGMVIIAGGAIAVIGGKMVNMLAGPILGTETLGFFAVASVFAMLPMSKVMPIVHQTMFPAFAKLHAQPEQIKIYILKSLELASVVIFPLTIGMSVVADQLVPIIFGERWQPIALPLAILSAMSIFRLINQIFNGPLNATGNASLVLKMQVLILLIFSIGAIPASAFGLMGLVILSVMSIVVQLLMTLIICVRIFNILIFDIFLAIRAALFSVLIMASILIFIKWYVNYNTPSFIYLILIVGLGALIYLCCLFLIFKEKYNELISIFNK
ncbi:lipopolysaccharide biosynthesis protein [bacterium]|nr:lipopolysaccharide biosynthesis protein [bacterium]